MFSKNFFFINKKNKEIIYDRNLYFLLYKGEDIKDAVSCFLKYLFFMNNSQQYYRSVL